MHPRSLRRSSLKYNPVFSVHFSLRATEERSSSTRLGAMDRNELTGRSTSMYLQGDSPKVQRTAQTI